MNRMQEIADLLYTQVQTPSDLIQAIEFEKAIEEFDDRCKELHRTKCLEWWQQNSDQDFFSVWRNYRIIMMNKGRRKRYAIYRLYRYISMPLNLISRLTGLSRTCIQYEIGEAFKEQCHKNSCWANKFLT